MKVILDSIAKRIGHSFSDPDLLALALTHPSCGQGMDNNQRLEFLGDAVLDLVIAEALYREYPDLDEGALDHMRAGLVNGRTLAATARALDIGSALQVSEAQQQHNAEPTNSMLEDALEAVIGAIYMDGGLEAARTFVRRALATELAAAADTAEARNPKGRLQEWSQRHYGGAVPEYYSISETGPDHARAYTAGVRLNGGETGRGEGPSKKAAESAAARSALVKLGI